MTIDHDDRPGDVPPDGGMPAMSDPPVRSDPTVRFDSADGDPLEHLDDHERRPELRRRRRMTSPLTWVLVGAVVAAGAFAIGAKVGDDHGLGELDAAPSTGIGAPAASGRGSSGFGTGGLGGARGAAGASAAGGSGGTVGQVQLVDGTNLYVQTFDGGVVKVTTGPSTTVTALAPSTLANLKVGSTVVVQGSAGPDGTLSATTVSQGGGRGGGFGGGGGGSGGGSGGGGSFRSSGG